MENGGSCEVILHCRLCSAWSVPLSSIAFTERRDIATAININGPTAKRPKRYSYMEQAQENLSILNGTLLRKEIWKMTFELSLDTVATLPSFELQSFAMANGEFMNLLESAADETLLIPISEFTPDLLDQLSCSNRGGREANKVKYVPRYKELASCVLKQTLSVHLSTASRGFQVISSSSASRWDRFFPCNLLIQNQMENLWWRRNWSLMLDTEQFVPQEEDCATSSLFLVQRVEIRFLSGMNRGWVELFSREKSIHERIDASEPMFCLVLW